MNSQGTKTVNEQVQNDLIISTKRVRIQFNLLGLNMFVNDQIVFPEPTLKAINSNVSAALKQDKLYVDFYTSGLFMVYALETEAVKKKIVDRFMGKPVVSEGLKGEINRIHMEHAYIGWYHHRVMFHADLEIPDGIFRPTRSELTEIGKELIGTYLTDSMNECQFSVHKGGHVRNVLYYPLMFFNGKYDENRELPSVFSDRTTTMTFDIVDTGGFTIKPRFHSVRISIPSTIVYGKLYRRKNKSKSLHADLVNVIYHYCLYERKMRIIRLETSKENDTNLTDQLEKESVLTEEDLVRLWSHVQDSLGGKKSDFTIAKLTLITIILGVCAVFLGVFNLGVALLEGGHILSLISR